VTIQNTFIEPGNLEVNHAGDPNTYNFLFILNYYLKK